MIYIYDIILNFNKELIEYFEWEEQDELKYINRIGLFKVDQKVINDFITKKVEINEEFLNQIPKYEMNGLKPKTSVFLISDGLIAIGVLIKEKEIYKISRMLLDEEKEVIEKINKIEKTKIEYKIIDKKNIEKSLLTRKEKNIKKNLEKEIKTLYQNQKYNKLKYLYYEYTNKESNNEEKIYKFLINSLQDFNQKHYNLYEILCLSKEIVK